MVIQNRDEIIGKIYRQQAEDREALAFIDSELSDAASSFKRAATQIECLISHERADVGLALSKINIDRVLKRLAQREQLQRKLTNAQEQLRRLTAK